MFKVDVRLAMDVLLPRYNHAGNSGANWPITGKKSVFNSQILPANVDRAMRKCVDRYDEADLMPPIRYLDVSGPEVWFIQRQLLVGTLMFMLRKLWKWQNWSRKRLPLHVLYKGRIIVWNGTHRTVLCRLAGKRIRTRVIDLDWFFEWRKKYPNGTAKEFLARGKKK